MSEQEKQLEKNLVALCQWFWDRNQSFGLAESCSGGLLSTWITSQPGVSSFFCGSVVSYASSVKEDLLGVPRYALESYGEVSVPVALYMARGARAALNCHWSLSITGVAGPSGGSEEKPVGTVCFALCGPGVEKREQRYFDGGDRAEIQYQSAFYALEFLLTTLNE